MREQGWLRHVLLNTCIHHTRWGALLLLVIGLATACSSPSVPIAEEMIRGKYGRVSSVTTRPAVWNASTRVTPVSLAKTP